MTIEKKKIVYLSMGEVFETTKKNVLEDSRYRRSICSNDNPFVSGMTKYLLREKKRKRSQE